MMDRVNEPVDDEEETLVVRVELAVDPGGGVTGPGRLMETPDGAEPTQE